MPREQAANEGVGAGSGMSSVLWANRSAVDRHREEIGGDLAMSELDRIAGGEKWPSHGRVFPTATGAAFTAYHKGKAKLDKLMSKDGGSPMLPWRLHDLRRTLATGFQWLGVRFEVTEAVLNHVEGSRSGVADIYQRHDWKPETRQALAMWNDHLTRVIAAVPK